MNLKIYHFFLTIAFMGVTSCSKDIIIDNAPKPPICLVKSYSTIDSQNSRSALGGISNLIYNDEGKVIAYGYDGSRKSVYIEDKLNLGSILNLILLNSSIMNYLKRFIVIKMAG